VLEIGADRDRLDRADIDVEVADPGLAGCSPSAVSKVMVIVGPWLVIAR
jgi:hypothetical protein